MNKLLYKFTITDDTWYTSTRYHLLRRNRMEKMEVLRYKLYEALEKGEKKEILFLSRKLDKYIVQKTKELMSAKK